MKRFFTVAMVLAATLIFVPNAFALTWFWGTDPNVTYKNTDVSGSNRVWLPFTVISEGDNLDGGQADGNPFLNGEYSPAVRLDFNMGGYWGVYTGTTLIPTGLAVATMPGYDALPDGVYTSDPTLQLNYWGANDPDKKSLLWAFSLNAYEITVGDVPQTNVVPEPATMALFGIGLTGMAFRRRKA